MYQVSARSLTVPLLIGWLLAVIIIIRLGLEPPPLLPEVAVIMKHVGVLIQLSCALVLRIDSLK